MSNVIKKIGALFCLFWAFFCMSCETDVLKEGNLFIVNSIELDRSSVELVIGDTLVLTAIIQPHNINVNQIEWDNEVENSVFWKSDNTEVATISNDGVIVARNRGYCNVYYVYGGYAVKCSVIVRCFDVNSLYGSWKTVDSKSYRFNIDQTGSYEGKAFRWTFDGMRLQLQYVDNDQTFIVTRVEPNIIEYYDSNDEQKKKVSLKAIPTVISSEDLQKGVIRIEGEDGIFYEAIDLGLPSGTLWAKTNLLSNSPEQVGEYFAWGETESKPYYTLDNYKWYNVNTLELIKYNVEDAINKNVTRLSYVDDAANINMGGKWRLPTKNEIEELLDNSIYIWSALNGVYGVLFISVKEGYKGNSIFLPMTGYVTETVLNNESFNNFMGLYWSSTISSDNVYNAGCLYFLLDLFSDKFYKDVVYTEVSRYTGAYIRPVVNLSSLNYD